MTTYLSIEEGQISLRSDEPSIETWIDATELESIFMEPIEVELESQVEYYWAEFSQHIDAVYMNVKPKSEELKHLNSDDKYLWNRNYELTHELQEMQRYKEIVDKIANRIAVFPGVGLSSEELEEMIYGEEYETF